MSIQKLLVAAMIVAAPSTRIAHAGPRDVQIRSVEIQSRIIELFNFGSEDQALDGWRFCTHDENQSRIYSSLGGLDGVVTEAQTSLFIHLKNDAPVSPDAIDAQTVGPFAGPLDTGPFAIELYYAPAFFSDPGQIADHLQWSVNGVDDSRADERSDEAQEGGVWTAADAWITTTLESRRIELLDDSGAELHGPGDYRVTEDADDVSPRSVQIVFVDIGRSVVELFNFSPSPVDLDGWVFCSHDEDESRVYTRFDGMDGVTIPGRGTLRVHLRDDAPDSPDAINASAVGPFASPFDTGPYSLGLYFPPVDFDDGRQLADHLQWSVGGVHDVIAAERSDEAVSGGVWAEETAWIDTEENTLEIHLVEPEGLELHGPDDYVILPESPSVPLFVRGDCNDDGSVDISDAVCILILLFSEGTEPGCRSATNVDGIEVVSITDPIYLLTFLFLRGPAPVEPFPGCGPGTEADRELGCATPPKNCLQ